MAHLCCNVSAGFEPKQMDCRKVEGLGALITGLALIVIASCLVVGLFTPGIAAHIANYSAAGLAVLSLVPLAVAACILCREPSSK